MPIDFSFLTQIAARNAEINRYLLCAAISEEKKQISEIFGNWAEIDHRLKQLTGEMIEARNRLRKKNLAQQNLASAKALDR